MKTLYLAAGGRPHFMKISPLVRALRAHGTNPGFKIIDTSQHYVHELDDVFFDKLCVPAPDAFSGPDSGSQATQVTCLRRWWTAFIPISKGSRKPFPKLDAAFLCSSGTSRYWRISK